MLDVPEERPGVESGILQPFADGHVCIELPQGNDDGIGGDVLVNLVGQIANCSESLVLSQCSKQVRQVGSGS